MYMQKWQQPRRKAFKFMSANEFGNCSSRQRPTTSIFHEIFAISNFTFDLALAKFHLKRIFPNAAPEPTPPTNMPQQTHTRKLQSIGSISRNMRKRQVNAGKPGKHFHGFDVPRPRTISFHGKRNTVYTTHVHLEMTMAAPRGIEIRANERIWSFSSTSEATTVNISWNFEFYIWPCPRKISH